MKIHTIKTPLVNSYLIEEDNRLLLIDASRGGEPYVVGHLEEVMQRSVSDLELVISTHDDFDHSGGVVALARECKARFGLPHAAYSTSKRLLNEPLSLFYRPLTIVIESFRPRMWKMYFNPSRSKRVGQAPKRHTHQPSVAADKKIQPDFFLKHQQSIPGFPNWEVIHTPGHSWDSCCYFHHPSKSLISGDTLLASNKLKRLVLPSILDNPRRIRSSIRRLKALGPLAVYPGHGPSMSGAGLLDHF